MAITEPHKISNLLLDLRPRCSLNAEAEIVERPVVDESVTRRPGLRMLDLLDGSSAVSIGRSSSSRQRDEFRCRHSQKASRNPQLERF